MEHEKFYSNLFPNSYIVSCIVLFKSSQLTRFENDYQIFAPFPWNHRLKENVPQTHTHPQIFVSKIGAESTRGERSRAAIDRHTRN